MESVDRTSSNSRWEFKDGEKVRIVGLKRHSEFNGREGTIMRQEKGQTFFTDCEFQRSRSTRYFVKIDGVAKLASLASKNLRHTCDNKHRAMSRECSGFLEGLED
mmetsp:Transcript_8922/g.12490  ORF Transcript_8922/g.12490 Transcript_8922/m.12490 type:complete len:105 (+) Transcript_8922:97-411(+)|eukprot:CAMPEP_0184493792 /NCGR_PEP_ID=MMETSP0113_2-20130426/26955_1 /TAXON_ID=91329 /ORGANISM="Norrisiella sphaerica, Strain BC52" /LENGTH=104 /DNA_ID=CAMNT_0026879213 /DNA_START=38 /DNA_END=352 /DNA_ORIENTATION=-